MNTTPAAVPLGALLVELLPRLPPVLNVVVVVEGEPEFTPAGRLALRLSERRGSPNTGDTDAFVPALEALPRSVERWPAVER